MNKVYLYIHRHKLEEIDEYNRFSMPKKSTNLKNDLLSLTCPLNPSCMCHSCQMLMSVKSLHSTGVLLRLFVPTPWARTAAPALKDTLTLTPATLEQIVQVRVCGWAECSSFQFSKKYVLRKSKLKRKKTCLSLSLEDL